MTSSRTMTREELLEQAALDAFGLLDEFDTAEFNRQFEDAQPTVQEEIRRLQADLVTDPALIRLDVEPPASLRNRVLAAVAAAIEREEAQLAPIATIGRPRGGEFAESTSARARWATPGLFWRAAAFVLAAGTILMAYAWSDAVRRNSRIAELALGNGAESELRELIGPSFSDFVRHANSPAVVLKPVDANFPGTATMFVKNEGTAPASAFMLATALPALPAGQMYLLRVKIDEAWQDVRAFASNGILAGLRVDNLSAAMIASTSWQVVGPDGRTLLQT